jgi:hypothetical protein
MEPKTISQAVKESSGYLLINKCNLIELLADIEADGAANGTTVSK